MVCKVSTDLVMIKVKEHVHLLLFFKPPVQQSWKGGKLVSRHLSVHPSVNKIMSALYLPQYLLDPFHICTSYQATSEGVSRVKVIAKFQNLNLDFVLLWHGIWYESIVWVIMGRQGCSQNAFVLVFVAIKNKTLWKILHRLSFFTDNPQSYLPPWVLGAYLMSGTGQARSRRHRSESTGSSANPSWQPTCPGKGPRNL